MKTFKKIVVSILMIIALSLMSAYFYFDQKFTPEKNYLKIENESGNIPITWTGNNKSGLLLPIHFPKDSTTYYMQFDTGAAYTEFYSQAIQNVKGIRIRNNLGACIFYLGQSKITSDQIKISDTGKKTEPNGSLKIIGTLGADILEDRKTLINFKKNYIAFNIDQEPVEFKNNLIDFQFTKRKIVIRGILKDKEEKFLFDSGTSAYELLTHKENWQDLKSPHSKVIIEKAQSRPTILTTYTAASRNNIHFKNKSIPLNEVTYVEGFSKTQYLLMKFSGMTGMLGNKIFLKNCLYIDCSREKISIE
ncbi:hypothetical protein [Chryseobacterium pennipullorum]|uniref:Aspartyl protease n=1 Tax=Chryseobacterium pennipullorum TaxID=2258963 RepID=A0A3D9AZQ1_9FLAO|nr:hypothetical protein [Chryseobacterium pennipullorum]REC46729.1 hypothetical protein DRF67_12950 [Chryseobacterium pennipullorum]